MITQLVQAKDLKLGDVMCNSYAKGLKDITALRAVTTTSEGRPRKRPPVQVTVESMARDTRELYTDTVYLHSLVRVCI